MTMRFPIVFARAGGRARERRGQPSSDSVLGGLTLGGRTLGGLLALRRALADLGRDLHGLLDARRLDLGDDLVAVGQQGHVVWDRQIADVDVVSKSISDSTEYSIDCGRWSGSARMRTDSLGWRRVPPWSSTAGEIAGRHERDVDRQLLGHADEEEVHVEGPAIDRVDLDAETRTGLGFAPSTDRSTSAFGPLAAEAARIHGHRP